MGWTYTHKPKTQSVRDFFDKEFGPHQDDGSRILDCAVVNMREAYIAYRMKSGAIFCVVCLLDYRKGDFPYDFGYKDMDEASGPYAANCPKRILDLLSPIEDCLDGDGLGAKYAREWREACRENLKRSQKLTGLKAGDVLRFESPVGFRSGALKTVLKLVNKRKWLFVDPDDAMPRYKLSARYLKNAAFEIVKAA